MHDTCIRELRETTCGWSHTYICVRATVLHVYLSAYVWAMFACGAPPMAQQPRAAPKLRVLCLHGMGTSAAILQRQLRPLVDATLDDVEYAFLDGQEECPPV